MFHGQNCEQSNAFVTGTSILFLVVIIFSWLFALQVVFYKIKHTKKMWNAAMTSSLSVFLSISSLIPVVISNAFRSLKIGNETIERGYLLSIPLSLFGIFTVSASLNICLLWIELSCVAVRGLASQENVVRTSKFLIISCVIYASITLILFVVAKTYQAVAIFNIIAMFAVTVLFVKGSKMLSEQLSEKKQPYILPKATREEEKTENGQQFALSQVRRRASQLQQAIVFPKRRKIPKAAIKIVVCTKIVSVNSFLFCVACTGFAVFSSYADLGILAYVCSLFAVANPLLLHLCILTYLSSSGSFKKPFLLQLMLLTISNPTQAKIRASELLKGSGKVASHAIQVKESACGKHHAKTSACDPVLKVFEDSDDEEKGEASFVIVQTDIAERDKNQNKANNTPNEEYKYSAQQCNSNNNNSEKATRNL